jgi:uncharacterized phage protein gp47/JayE
MSFERPKLTELVERIQNDAEARYGKPVMRRSVIGVLSTVAAAVAHGLYGYIEYVIRQTFSSTAEGVFLERRASEYGITRKAATSAEGTVSLEGSGFVPAGTQLQTEDSVVYETVEDGTAPGVFTIQAVVAGVEGNLAAGETLTMISPISGVSSEAVASALEGGVDAEDDESLRGRLLDRQKNPPKAGTKEDYVAWALEVAGVTRAWCYPTELGAGNVTLRFMTDGLTDDGIPSDVLVKRVEEGANYSR